MRQSLRAGSKLAIAVLLPLLAGWGRLSQLSGEAAGELGSRGTPGTGEEGPSPLPNRLRQEPSRNGDPQSGLNRAQLAQTLALISGRWVFPVLDQLASGAKRYSELRDGLEGISEKVLTETLRRMGRDGLVIQVVAPGRSSGHLAYQATPLARSLDVVLKAVGRWQHGHWEQVTRARARWGGR